MLKEAVYRTLDVLTFRRGIRRRFSGETIRLPPRWSRYFKGDYEPQTFQFLRETLNPGDTFLDIGAHIGLFSVVAAQIVGDSGRVFSFEPTPFTRKVLSDVLRRNRVEKTVEVRAEAVGLESGTAEFFDSGDVISVVNSLISDERKGTRYEVSVVSLDSFVQAHELTVRSVKVDVEGAEYDFLRGGIVTLGEQKPEVLLSIHPPFIPEPVATIPKIWDLVQSIGYTIRLNGVSMTRSDFCSRTELFDVVLSA